MNQLLRFDVVQDDGPADLTVDYIRSSIPDLAFWSGMPVGGRGELAVD